MQSRSSALPSAIPSTTLNNSKMLNGLITLYSLYMWKRQEILHKPMPWFQLRFVSPYTMIYINQSICFKITSFGNDSLRAIFSSMMIAFVFIFLSAWNNWFEYLSLTCFHWTLAWIIIFFTFFSLYFSFYPSTSYPSTSWPSYFHIVNVIMQKPGGYFKYFFSFKFFLLDIVALLLLYHLYNPIFQKWHTVW